MESNPNVYRFSGLIAVLGLLALLVGLTVMVVLPSIRYAAMAILLLGILLLATAFIIDFRRVSRALTGRRGRFGTGTTVMVSIFIGITLLVNAISIGNYHRFDATGVAQFTLTQQTKDVLSKLETPLQVSAFFVPGDPLGDFITNLLNEYQNYTDQLSLKSIDPDEHPDQARQYGIMIYPTVVFESQYGYRLVLPQEIFVPAGQEIEADAEHPFTSAILEVTGTVQKKVYFLTGHGEANINSDYSFARKGLLDNLYKVGTLDLVFTPTIPEDAAALIIAGPQESLTSSEVKIIADYLEGGGWVMILINPNPPPEIKQLLSPWGVEIEDGIIIDRESYVAPNIASPIVPRLRNFFSLAESYFPGATAIIPQEGYTPGMIPGTFQIIWRNENTEIELYSLVRSSKDSWLEQHFVANEEPEFNEGLDVSGPLNIGFLIAFTLSEEASPAEAKLTRLIVFGDSDFASNQHYYNGNNSDLFLNAVNLLTVGKELISIERKILPFRRLIVGREATNFINYSSIGLLPLLVLAIGIIIWWRRR